jgi:hypothetical protein
MQFYSRKFFRAFAADCADTVVDAGSTMSLSPINPLAGTLMGGAIAQATADSEKTSQSRRVQNQRLNSAAITDQLEHEVESSQEVDPAGHEQHDSPNQRRRRRAGHPNDDDSDSTDDSMEHVDVTA